MAEANIEAYANIMTLLGSTTLHLIHVNLFAIAPTGPTTPRFPIGLTPFPLVIRKLFTSPCVA